MVTAVSRQVPPQVAVEQVWWPQQQILGQRRPVPQMPVHQSYPCFPVATSETLQADTCEESVLSEESSQAAEIESDDSDADAGLGVAEESIQAAEIESDECEIIFCRTCDVLGLMGGNYDEMWSKAAQEFEIDFGKGEMKMHRFPASLRDLGWRYIVPKVVAIGPYTRGFDHLKEMEKVKQVAAYQFFSGCHPRGNPRASYEAIHAAILSVAGPARGLYDEDAVAAIRDAEFVDMMILDGCFLLQYMLLTVRREWLYPSLLRCFHSNQACISNDIMLLENQLPWVVIETLNKFGNFPRRVEDFIAKMGRTLQVRGDKIREPFELCKLNYTPPHLLGLLRFYKIGGSTTGLKSYPDAIRPMSKTVSAIELAELGIKLTASKTTKLSDMGIKRRPLFSKIFLAPLLLDEMRTCWLVNMVAFETCIATDYMWGKTEMPVVCSYLAVIAMLMDREADVHELRSKRLLQGELTNKEMLYFFKSLIKHISGGPLYIEILQEIEDYRRTWWFLIKVHAFFYKNYKIIAAVLSIIGVLAGIFKAFLSLQKHSAA